MESLIILGIIGPIEIILLIAMLFFAIIVFLRGFGTWFFKIDEVIKLQKQILEELRRRNAEK